jgi:hypothetical protein
MGVLQQVRATGIYERIGVFLVGHEDLFMQIKQISLCLCFNLNLNGINIF